MAECFAGRAGLAASIEQRVGRLETKETLDIAEVNARITELENVVNSLAEYVNGMQAQAETEGGRQKEDGR